MSLRNPRRITEYPPYVEPDTNTVEDLIKSFQVIPKREGWTLVYEVWEGYGEPWPGLVAMYERFETQEEVDERVRLVLETESARLARLETHRASVRQQLSQLMKARIEREGLHIGSHWTRKPGREPKWEEVTLLAVTHIPASPDSVSEPTYVVVFFRKGGDHEDTFIQTLDEFLEIYERGD